MAFNKKFKLAFSFPKKLVTTFNKIQFPKQVIKPLFVNISIKSIAGLIQFSCNEYISEEQIDLNL